MEEFYEEESTREISSLSLPFLLPHFSPPIHRFSIYEPLVHRFAIEPREPRETRDRKRVSSFHRDDAGTFSHVRVSRRVQQRKEKTKRRSNVRTAFYFNALSTVHVVRGGRKRKRVYATLSTRKRWLTDRQALPILRV